MGKSLVLITGANGHLGYAIVLDTLRAGYAVRAVVRNEAGIERIKAGMADKPRLAQDLSFAIVPDITVPGAYDDEVRGCEYIIHCASPLAGIPGDLSVPAVNGCKNILKAAQANRSVKRIVFTGSTSSVRPFSRMLANDPDNVKVAAGKDVEVEMLTGSTRVPTPPALPDWAPGFERYTRSKIMAANCVRDFYASQKPHFSIVQLMPGFIIGPSGLVKSKKEAVETGSVLLAWLWFPFKPAVAYGRPPNEDVPQIAETVAFSDVVEAHVKALDTSKVPGSLLEYLMCSDGPRGPRFADAVGIIKQRLPEVVEKGQVSLQHAVLGTIPHHFDAHAVEREVLGRPLKSFEQIVTETVKWMGALPDA